MGRGAVCSAHACPHFDCSNGETLGVFLRAAHRLRLLCRMNAVTPAARASLRGKLPADTKTDLRCGKCGHGDANGGGPLYACMTCFAVGCWSGESHLKGHWNETHRLAMEVGSGTVYCGLCNVFIWNATMELVLKCPPARERLANVPQEGNGESHASPQKRKKGAAPSTELTVHPSSDGEMKQHCQSMRGLVNMGNTCFMASVLQVLLHCNRLCTFFLSVSHNARQCPRRGLKSTGGVCMACELDDLFTRNYSGETSPFAPCQFLHAMWRSSKHLAGYEQQDAHEFLISLLNQLHTDLGGSHFACKCPVHGAFTGVLQSDVTCLSCGTVNASFDPFIDISLDILTSANDASFILDPNTASLTLRECFQLFTHAEKLSSSTYLCATCNHTYQEATKQLSIRKAPEILTIHLKRFEHSLNTVKIDTFLQVPLQFSIFDYTTEGVHLANEVARISATGVGLNALTQPALSPTVIDPLYNAKKYCKSMLYRLVATVNHTGVVDAGHYVAYVQSSDVADQWFKFDDATVTHVSVATVLASNPYMLFYARVGDAAGSDSVDPVAID